MTLFLHFLQKYLIVISRIIGLAYGIWTLWIIWSVVYQPLQIDNSSINTKIDSYTISEPDLKRITDHVAQRQALADDFSGLVNPFHTTIEPTTTAQFPPLPIR